MLVYTYCLTIITNNTPFTFTRVMVLMTNCPRHPAWSKLLARECCPEKEILGGQSKPRGGTGPTTRGGVGGWGMEWRMLQKTETTLCHSPKPALPFDPFTFTVIKRLVIQRRESKREQSTILLQTHTKNSLVCLGKGKQGLSLKPKSQC